MTWLRVDDTAGDDPKLVVLSDAAHRAVIRSWIYAAKHETDGRLPTQIADDYCGRKRRVLDEILEQGLWYENGSGYVIHNFNKRNPTKAVLDARRAATNQRVARSRSKHVS